MKILYVTNLLRGGAISNILYNIIPYIKQEYEIELLSLQKVNYKDRIIGNIQDQGINIDSLRTNRLNIPGTYYKLRQYLNSKNPDIVHSHLGRADVLTALTKPRDSKLVTTFHNIKSNYNKLIQLGYKVTDNLVDVRTSVSKTVYKSWYENTNLKSDHCTIYNPVNINKFDNYRASENYLKDEFNLEKSEKIIINVGNLEEQKGHIYLIKAMNEVVKHNENIKLIIAGRDKGLKDRLQTEINNLNLEKNIILAGFRNDILKILKCVDLFVFPSIWEGLGIAVLEAMAARVPIIASNIEAINEYLENNQDALLVDPRNSNQIANNIITLLYNNKLRYKFIHNSYEKVNNYFSASKIAKKYSKLYNNLIKN